MHESDTRKVICIKCAFYLDPTYRFCPRCGTRQVQEDAWYYHPIWIFILAFAALGPFALPLVWKSPQMTSQGKIVMTTAILIYTLLCFYCGYVITAMILKEFSEVDRIMRLR